MSIASGELSYHAEWQYRQEEYDWSGGASVMQRVPRCGNNARAANRLDRLTASSCADLVRVCLRQRKRDDCLNELLWSSIHRDMPLPSHYMYSAIGN